MNSPLNRFKEKILTNVTTPIQRTFEEITKTGAPSLHQHQFSGRELVLLATVFFLAVTALGLMVSVGNI